MDKPKILLADDDEKIRDMVKEYMSGQGYVIHEAVDGVDALNILEKMEFSLVVLDIMMPKLDGWRVLKRLRETSEIPVIMLSARGEEYDKLHGFELGADDYMVKPFSPKELLARIKAILGRTIREKERDENETFVYKGLMVDFASRDVYVDGKSVSMTPKEHELLRYFIQNARRALTREQLLAKVWGYDYMGDDRTVDTHVKMLRDSLGAYRKLIVTVWGTGYKFQPSEES
ncbi:MAG: response regulator transcription factor [Clostridia bacterium]